MPIYDRGYRHWEGPLRHPLLRWWAIARTGIALGMRGKLLRRVLFFAWAPLLYFGPLFFSIGKITDPSADQAGMWFEIAEEFLGRPLAELARSRPDIVRPFLWSLVFAFFIGWVQLTIGLIVTAIVTPPLIARDIRSKAFFVYFSKPITTVDYLIGKVAIGLGFLAWVTLIPALLLYLVSVVFSPALSVIADTGVVALRIVAGTLVATLPMVAIGLLLSSLTRDERLPMFAWIGVCVFGEVFYNVVANSGGDLADSDSIVLLSIRRTIMSAVQEVFGAAEQFHELSAAVPGVLPALPRQGPSADIVGLAGNSSGGLCLVFLAVVTVACFAIVSRRVSAPVRI